MIRKVIRQGKQAYTVTLPVEWIRTNSLEAGSEISLQPTEDRLLISPVKQRVKKRSITLKLEGSQFNLFLATLIETYTLGYDLIIIHTNAKNARKHLEKITSQYFLGFELTQQNASSYTIENISEPENAKFDTIMRKMFLLCIDSFKDIVDNINNLNTERGEEIKKKLERMEQYNNFCMRCIIQKITSVQAVPQTWLILSFLTKFKRSFVYLIDIIQKKKIKPNKKIENILSALHENLEGLYSAYYAQDIEKTNEIYEKNRELLFKQIHLLSPKGQDETILFAYMIEFQRLNSYMTAPIMAVSLGKKYQL